MTNAPLSRKRFPVTLEQNRRIEDAVDELLIARDRKNFEGFVEALPGEGVYFPKQSPREELVFYEAQDETYWANLYRENPDTPTGLGLASKRFRRFADLVMRYRQ